MPDLKLFIFMILSRYRYSYETTCRFMLSSLDNYILSKCYPVNFLSMTCKHISVQCQRSLGVVLAVACENEGPARSMESRGETDKHWYLLMVVFCPRARRVSLSVLKSGFLYKCDAPPKIKQMQRRAAKGGRRRTQWHKEWADNKGRTGTNCERSRPLRRRLPPRARSLII